MNKRARLLAGLFVLGLLLVSCGPPPAAEITPADQPAEPTEAEAGAPTAVPAPTETSVPTPTEEPEEVSACVACHMDAELLKTLATEAEPTESLSTGEG
ncbi:MAG: hypothetical protein Kow00124_31030 [Anaerolineae bacterium]